MRMVRWMCNASLRELRYRLGLAGIMDCVRKRRLGWFGHVERMDVDNWVKKCMDLDVESSWGGEDQGTHGMRLLEVI